MALVWIILRWFSTLRVLAVTGRDKDATWGPTNARGWSKQRVVHALQNRLLPFRTWPADIAIDWYDPYVLERFDVQASRLTKFVPGPRVPPILASRQIDVDIEILWPPVASDIEAPSLPPPSAAAPAASPMPREGYQSTRVAAALDPLEGRGLKLGSTLSWSCDALL